MIFILRIKICCNATKAYSFPGGTSGEEPVCQGRRCKRLRFDPWVGKIPWRRKWHLSPVFLPEKSHGQRSLVGYIPGGCKERGITEHTRTHTITSKSPHSEARRYPGQKNTLVCQEMFRVAPCHVVTRGLETPKDIGGRALPRISQI